MSGCAYAGSNGGVAGCRPGSPQRTFERNPKVRNFEIGKSGLSIGSNNGRALAVFDNARKGDGSEPIRDDRGNDARVGNGEMSMSGCATPNALSMAYVFEGGIRTPHDDEIAYVR